MALGGWRRWWWWRRRQPDRLTAASVAPEGGGRRCRRRRWYALDVDAASDQGRLLRRRHDERGWTDDRRGWDRRRHGNRADDRSNVARKQRRDSEESGNRSGQRHGMTPFPLEHTHHTAFGILAARHRRRPDDPPRPTANDDEEVEQDLRVPCGLDARRERSRVARLFSQMREAPAQPPGERVRPVDGAVREREPFGERVVARARAKARERERRRASPLASHASWQATPARDARRTSSPAHRCRPIRAGARIDPAPDSRRVRRGVRGRRDRQSAPQFHSRRRAASHPRPARTESATTPRT